MWAGWRCARCVVRQGMQTAEYAPLKVGGGGDMAGFVYAPDAELDPAEIEEIERVSRDL